MILNNMKIPFCKMWGLFQLIDNCIDWQLLITERCYYKLIYKQRLTTDTTIRIASREWWTT